MLNKNLLRKIKKAAEEMTMNDLYDFLQDLYAQGKIAVNQDGYDRVIDFAQYLVGRMQSALESGEWIGYELRALQALEDIPVDESDLIKIDSYGYPQKIKDNYDLLYVLGVESQLVA